MLRFGEYQLDSVQGLSRGDDEVRVTPKSLSVLRVLADRAGQVVTKDEIFRLVWAETAVSDTALTSCIQELRHAFQDDARKPRFIETVHRRGYRFLPRTATASRHEMPHATTASTAAPEPLLVGRDDVVNQLLDVCDASIRGVRQTVFVTGDAGVGKTAVVQAFLARASARGVRFALGQCVEHYGVGEPYQPLLEALTRLCRQPGSDEAIAAMEHHAPTWLAQLPGLLAPDRLEALQRTTAGTTRERMLRELTGVLEGITARDPLVLWLDDLHWSDASTLDWDRCVLATAGTGAGHADRHLPAVGNIRSTPAACRADRCAAGQGIQPPHCACRSERARGRRVRLAAVPSAARARAGPAPSRAARSPSHGGQFAVRRERTERSGCPTRAARRKGRMDTGRRPRGGRSPGFPTTCGA